MKSGRRKESRKEKSSVVKWQNEAGAKAVAVDMFMQAATHTRSKNTHISSTHTLSLSLTNTPPPQTVITSGNAILSCFCVWQFFLKNAFLI